MRPNEAQAIKMLNILTELWAEQNGMKIKSIEIHERRETKS